MKKLTAALLVLGFITFLGTIADNSRPDTTKRAVRDKPIVLDSDYAKLRNAVLVPHRPTPSVIPGPPDVIAGGPAKPNLISDQPSSPHGIFRGSFDVDANGNATYEVPLELPPARRGFGPRLALRYNSGRGVSYVGVGWSLMGIDAVYRCGHGFGQDGATRAVRLDADDHFCYRGERLVEVPRTASRGAIEFRTERDSFSRIVGFDNGRTRGSSNWRMMSFAVETADGNKRFYGTSDASRTLDGINHTRRWHLDKVSDRTGNYWTVSYEKPSYSGPVGLQGEDVEVIPTSVSFTGNDGSGGGGPINPKNTVVFEYDTHPKPQLGYTAGVAYGMSQRLTRIVTYHDGNVALIYDLRHEESSITGRSLLTSILKCDQLNVCLPKLSFDYSKELDSFSGPYDVSSAIFFSTGLPEGRDNFPTAYSADTDGDGRANLIVRYPTGGHHVFFTAALLDSNPPTFGARERANWRFPQNEPGRFQVKFADMTSDGRDDLLYHRQTADSDINPYWMLATAASDGSLGNVNDSWGPTNKDGHFFDLNGDGRRDGFFCTTHRPRRPLIAFGNGNGLADRQSFPNLDYPCVVDYDNDHYVDNKQFVDLDADGATDLLFVDRDDVVKVARFNTGSPEITALAVDPAVFLPDSPTTIKRVHRWADVNGDGLKDLIYQKLAHDNQVLESRIFRNTGKELRGTLGDAYPTVRLDTAHITDVNGDGRDDFVDVDTAAAPVIYLSRDFERFEWTVRTSTLPVSTARVNVWGDFDGNGVDDLISYDQFGLGVGQLYLHKSQRPDLLKVVNEAGSTDNVSVDYALLSDRDTYRRNFYSCEDQFPSYCANGGRIYVVRAVEIYQGPTQQNARYEYEYENARIDLQGRGWLGFGQVEKHHVNTRTTTTNLYDLATYDRTYHRYPLSGRPVEVRTRTLLSNNTGTELPNLYKTERIYKLAVAGDASYFVYPEHTTNAEYYDDTSYRRYTPDRAHLSITETQRIDAFGNPEVVVESSGDSVTTTIRTYLNDTTNWLIRRARTETTTSTLPPGHGAKSQTTEWGYKPQTGLLDYRIENLGAGGMGAKELRYNFQYDPYGNLTDQIVTALDGTSRTIIWRFEQRDKVHATRVINAKGHETRLRYHPAHGGIREIIDPNGENQLIGYDNFGRVVEMRDADGSTTTVEYMAPFGSGGLSYSVQVTEPGHPAERTYFDVLGREVLTVTTAYDGGVLWRATLYDDAGNLAAVTSPTSGSSGPEFYFLQNDELGRPQVLTQPDGSQSKFYYAPGLGSASPKGQRVTHIGPRGKATTYYYNGNRQLEQVVDALGENTFYRYGPFGHLAEVEDAQGNVTRTYLDAYGYTVWQEDTDLGTIQTTYNGFGEVHTENHGGITVTFERDALGRPTKRTASTGEVSTWTYDIGSHGIGRLREAISADGVVTRQEFDAFGRLSASEQEVAGRKLRLGFEYDQHGRVEVIHYPPARDGNSFSLRRRYHNGYLWSLQDNDSGFVFWKLVATDRRGQVGIEQFGNGVEASYDYDSLGRMKSRAVLDAAGTSPLKQLTYYYDEAGNLIGRVDHRQAMTERFAYDDMDRLTRAWFKEGTDPVYPPSPLPLADPDDFAISAWTPPSPEDVADREQNPLKVDPIEALNEGVKLANSTNDVRMTTELRELVALTATNQGPPRPGDQDKFTSSYELSYDALGNIKSRSDVGTYDYLSRGAFGTRAHAASTITSASGATWALNYDAQGYLTSDGVRNYAYNPEGLPSKIELIGSDTAFFAYDAFGRRATKRTRDSNQAYFAGLYLQRDATPIGPILPQASSHYFLYMDGRVVAEVQHQDPGVLLSGRRHILYHHIDFMGSTELLTNSRGEVTEERSYNAWGQARSPDWVRGAKSITEHVRPIGFTGHEDDPELGLVNMIGRIYDPAISRFTTPDPFVQATANSQSLNRFSYVLNNPMAYTDPTGFNTEPEVVVFEEGSTIRSTNNVDRREPIIPNEDPTREPTTGDEVAPGLEPDLVGPTDRLDSRVTNDGRIPQQVAFQIVRNNDGLQARCSAGSCTIERLKRHRAVGYSRSITKRGRPMFIGLGDPAFAEMDRREALSKPGNRVALELATLALFEGAGRILFWRAATKSETFYRTMSKPDYDTLVGTGKLPATSETFTSPTRAFAEGYEGVLVQFKVKPGTTQALSGIGVRDTSAIARQAYPGMPTVSKGWTSNNAFFKGEGQQVNIGLGRGKALDRFNKSIESFQALSK